MVEEIIAKLKVNQILTNNSFKLDSD